MPKSKKPSRFQNIAALTAIFVLLLYIFFLIFYFFNLNSKFVNSKFFLTSSVSPSPVPLPTTDYRPASPTGRLLTVSFVYDGDTIYVAPHNQSVRLLGIDSPERDECGGTEAKEKTMELVLNRAVLLESDPEKPDRDKYNRLLRYVFLASSPSISNPASTSSSDLDISLEMLRAGFAREARYAENYAKREAYLNAQKEAKANKLGIWGMCNPR